MNILISSIVYTLAKVFFIFPFKTNQILFQSFDFGKDYTCNPKYICEYLKKTYPGEYEMVWVFQDPQAHDVPGMKKVKYYSPAWFKACATSKVIVLNSTPAAYMPKRKGQKVIETWHAGGAYKRIGLSDNDDAFETWRYNHIRKYIDVFLSSSRAFTQSNIIEGFRYKGEIMKCGMPRNSILLDAEKRDMIRQIVRRKLDIHGIVILYAPTFRGHTNQAKKRENAFPYAQVIEWFKERYEKHITLLVRNHYLDQNTYDYDADIVDVSEYPDMQELLCAADVMINDYSSSMWDFALMEKPCLLYVPDLAFYEKQDRGFFTPIQEWPGILCHDQDELKQAIENLEPEHCAQIARRHIRQMGSYENENATKIVCDRIRQWTK